MTQVDDGKDRAQTQPWRPSGAAGGPWRPGQWPHDQQPDDQRPAQGLPGQGLADPVHVLTVTPEGRFLATSGKPLSRHASDLREQAVTALARFAGATAAVQYASRRSHARQVQHRGGSRPWPLRSVIPVATAAEVLTAFVAMEELVSSFVLAAGLAVMAALAGAGTAAMIASRRLSGLPVQASARILESLFVVGLTLLRFGSLDVQSGDLTASLGGAGLAALISAIALLAIEEVLVETETCGVFVSRVLLCWRRWHCARATSRLARVQARAEAAGDRFHRHYLGFLVKSEGLGTAEAQRHAHALRVALFPHAAPAASTPPVTGPGDAR